MSADRFRPREAEQALPFQIVTGQVQEVLSWGIPIKIRLLLSGLNDEAEEEELDAPEELPLWTLDGSVFLAELSEDIRTWDDLRARPWALRRCRPTPCPWMTADELTEPRT